MTSPSPTHPQSSGDSTRTFTLQVRGMSEVPSFKNSKEIVRIAGRPSLKTAKKKQAWMDQCIQSFASQLTSALRTTDGGTQTGCSQRCLTALFMQSPPFDDRVQIIKELHVTTEKVGKGEEGAIIIIELLNP